MDNHGHTDTAMSKAVAFIREHKKTFGAIALATSALLATLIWIPAVRLPRQSAHGPPPPLFSDQRRPLRAAETMLARTGTLSSVEVNRFAKEYTDSLAVPDRSAFIARLHGLARSDELHAFLQTASSERWTTFNTALLPAPGETTTLGWNVPGFGDLDFDIERVLVGDSTEYYRGRSLGGDATIFFFRDSVITGVLNVGSRSFEFHTNEWGAIRFSNADTSQYTPEAPPVIPAAKPPSGLKSTSFLEDPAAATAPCIPDTLRLLVAVTPSANNASASPDNDIRIAVRQAELALKESNIITNLEYRIVHIKNELSGNSASVLKEFRTGTSPAAVEIASAMQQVNADAAYAILATVADGWCGRSFIQAQGEPFEPFGFVLRRCLLKASLAHELTHLLGANHASPLKPSYSTDSYGHTTTSHGFRTIEAVCDAGSTCSDRVEKLSDKTKREYRVPRGSTVANSARAFRESVCNL